MKKHFPNTLTCCNLLCGCFATLAAYRGDYTAALLFIVVGAVFDFFDGFAARLLHVSSPIGKELDSLADNVTFGFAPATIVFSLMRNCAAQCGATAGAGCAMYDADGACPLSTLVSSPAGQWLPYVAFLISAFSALRLAKFNLDERQSTSFIGLPTPANALFWGAAAYGLHNGGITSPSSAPLFALLFVGTLLCCYLLVSEIPMFALKFKSFGWKGNELRYTFIAVSAALIALFGVVAFSAVIVLYVLTSVCANLFKKK
jgi:CDP-diacylglycerol---serine O-phosphatidyltransferase